MLNSSFPCLTATLSQSGTLMPKRERKQKKSTNWVSSFFKVSVSCRSIPSDTPRQTCSLSIICIQQRRDRKGFKCLSLNTAGHEAHLITGKRIMCLSHGGDAIGRTVSSPWRHGGSSPTSDTGFTISETNDVTLLPCHVIRFQTRQI